MRVADVLRKLAAVAPPNPDIEYPPGPNFGVPPDTRHVQWGGRSQQADPGFWATLSGWDQPRYRTNAGGLLVERSAPSYWDTAGGLARLVSPAWLEKLLGYDKTTTEKAWQLGEQNQTSAANAVKIEEQRLAREFAPKARAARARARIRPGSEAEARLNATEAYVRRGIGQYEQQIQQTQPERTSTSELLQPKPQVPPATPPGAGGSGGGAGGQPPALQPLPATPPRMTI